MGLKAFIRFGTILLSVEDIIMIGIRPTPRDELDKGAPGEEVLKAWTMEIKFRGTAREISTFGTEKEIREAFEELTKILDNHVGDPSNEC